MVATVLSKCEDEMAFFAKTQDLDVESLSVLANKPFSRVSYTDAVAQLAEESERSPDRFEFNEIEWGMDLQVCSPHCCGMLAIELEL